MNVIEASLHPDVKVGDWCTQYAAGYWQVVEILPKYAEKDQEYEGAQYKKGDHIGHFVLMKKGFTPKLKFRTDCDVADAAWCRPVSEEIRSRIDEFLLSHPKEKQKFDSLPWKDVPAVSAIEMNDLTDEEFAFVHNALLSLPECFTEAEFRSFVRERGIDRYFSETRGGSSVYLYVFAIPYRYNENREILYSRPELKRMA